MDPHLLRSFVAVARRRSFSAAARELGFTQSAVSQQVAALEADLGAVLLNRRPVTPTRAGARLLDHAVPLLLRLDAARADVARLAAPPSARVVVGASPLAVTALGPALADVRREHPDLVVTVRVLGRSALIREVATAAVDVGLADGAVAPSDSLPLPDAGPLRAVGVLERPLAVLLPPRHPLAGRAGLRLADLAAAGWIDAPDTAVPLGRLRTAAGAEGYRASVRYEGTDVGGLVALVGAGHGLAVLPDPTGAALSGVTAVPVTEPRLVHRVEAVHSPTLAGVPAALAAALTG
ncbi:LysR family transcriptional regulator [Actinophytocola xanthii]|uniref:LysR family transcriptional regulator n=1 Tax=Actinophytocola xanthii TaxID=1912961 RepID=UPI001E42EC0C|nr:LysR family transcriptional regulator [Actinophytocola xanthii]